MLKTERTEDWHLATALVTSEAAFATLSVQYAPLCSTSCKYRSRTDCTPLSRTETRVHNLLLRLAFTSKSTALWHLSSVTVPAQRLSRWVHHALLPLIHGKAHGEFAPAYAVLPLKSTWRYPLGMVAVL